MDTLKYYRDRLAQYGPTYQAVDAGSEDSLIYRHSILASILRGGTVLDVGCGYGRFCIHSSPKHYLGIDVLPEMIEAARKLYPDCRFEVGDIAHPKPEWEADYVVASGMFQFGDLDWVYTALTHMCKLARKGVAVNFLREGAKEEFVVNSWTIGWMARLFSPYYTIRADYLPNDFTLFLYKERP